MVELRSKILIKTSQVGYGMKLAWQLKKMGLDAVVRSSLKRLPDENYKVILMDYEDDSIPEPEHNTQIIVMTNDDNPDSYVVHILNTQSEVLSILKELIDIDSPIGFKKIEHYICSYLYEFGYSPEVRKGGGIYCTINESSEKHILLTAHMDSLGAMVKNVSKDGHLDISPLGGLNANNIEGENCRIYTRCGKTLTGVIQLKNPSIHVNNSYDDTKRTFDTIEVVIDSDVNSENDVFDLGIDVGDFIAIEPRFTIT